MYIFTAPQIRLVVEEGLNCMPSDECVVKTPMGRWYTLSCDNGVIVRCTGEDYEGIKFRKMNCAVSIVRNGESPQPHLLPHPHSMYTGEAMEKGLRECCRSIRIGKILIRKEQDTKKAKVRITCIYTCT